jgi:hypothetical protein
VPDKFNNKVSVGSMLDLDNKLLRATKGGELMETLTAAVITNPAAHLVLGSCCSSCGETKKNTFECRSPDITKTSALYNGSEQKSMSSLQYTDARLMVQ